MPLKQLIHAKPHFSQCPISHEPFPSHPTCRAWQAARFDLRMLNSIAFSGLSGAPPKAALYNTGTALWEQCFVHLRCRCFCSSPKGFKTVARLEIIGLGASGLLPSYDSKRTTRVVRKVLRSHPTRVRRLRSSRPRLSHHSTNRHAYLVCNRESRARAARP